MEEELAKVANDKGPEEKLLTCAEWEAIQQRLAEKGQQAWENAGREFEERKQSGTKPSKHELIRTI